jgi:hypothetical protein
VLFAYLNRPAVPSDQSTLNNMHPANWFSYSNAASPTHVLMSAYKSESCIRCVGKVTHSSLWGDLLVTTSPNTHFDSGLCCCVRSRVSKIMFQKGCVFSGIKTVPQSSGTRVSHVEVVASPMCANVRVLQIQGTLRQ